MESTACTGHERNGPRSERCNRRRIALLHFVCCRPHRRESKVQLTMSAVHSRAVRCAAADGGIFENFYGQSHEMRFTRKVYSRVKFIS